MWSITTALAVGHDELARYSQRREPPTSRSEKPQHPDIIMISHTQDVITLSVFYLLQVSVNLSLLISLLRCLTSDRTSLWFCASLRGLIGRIPVGKCALGCEMAADFRLFSSAILLRGRACSRCQSHVADLKLGIKLNLWCTWLNYSTTDNSSGRESTPTITTDNYKSTYCIRPLFLPKPGTEQRMHVKPFRQLHVCNGKSGRCIWGRLGPLSAGPAGAEPFARSQAPLRPQNTVLSEAYGRHLSRSIWQSDVR